HGHGADRGGGHGERRGQDGSCAHGSPRCGEARGTAVGPCRGQSGTSQAGMHIRSVTAAGALPLARKPTVVEPPGGMVAFQLSLVNIAIEPVLLFRPFHTWVTVVP